ncbi:MAG: outer membrane protein transport protein [Kofleriaceae bacterium]|nr:outer membrane protein transport protein [Kofleriaceae bacterium]
MHRLLGGLIGFSTLCLAPSLVSAGGFASARFGGEQAYPTSDSPTAIYYNPAALALGSGTRIFAEGVFIYRNVEYNRPVEAINNVADGELGTPTDAITANSGKATLSNVIVSPFLGVASDLGVENLGVGLAFFAPFGGQADWDQNDEYRDSEAYPGAVDGVARFSTMQGLLREVYISGAVAYRLPGPRLSFGASFSVVSQSVNTIRARNASGNDDIVGPVGLIEGRSHVDVKGITVAAGLGLLWEASDNFSIGLSYQSQPGFGETSQEGNLNKKFGNNDSDSSKIDFVQELPDITRLGFRYKPKDNLEVRFVADYTRWSVFRYQCLKDANDPASNCDFDDNGAATDKNQGVVVNIPRYWDDTFGLRLGGSYWLDEDKEITAGLTYDSSAVPDRSIDPSLLDQDKIVGSIGGRMKINDNMLVNLSYTHVYYFERDVAPRERDVDGNGIGFDSPSSVPDHAGVYNQYLGLINLGLEYQF